MKSSSSSGNHHRSSSVVALVDHSDRTYPRRRSITNMLKQGSNHDYSRSSADQTSSQMDNSSGQTPRQTASLSSSTAACCCGLGKVNRTTLLRISFLVSLVATALVCGLVTQRVIYDLEKEVGLNTFESVASSAVERAQEIALRKVGAAIAVASMVRHAFPNASDWPFVTLPGFSQTAQLVSKLSETQSQGLIMLVHNTRARAFEDFARESYRHLGYPNTSGVNDFGFGISKRTPTGERVHDVNGTTDFESPHDNLLFPIFQHSNRQTGSLMFNVHSEQSRGVAIDSMVDCTQLRHEESANDNVQCLVVTDFIELLRQPGPAALIYAPVYPANNESTLVGIIGTTIHWQQVLHNVVPDYIHGLDCVISTKTNSFTFRLEGGEPFLVGEGDYHEQQYEHLGHSVVLTAFQTQASASRNYTLTIYPRNHLITSFVSNSRFVFSIGFVAVIVFCGCLFFLYDFFMKHESHQRKKVLEIKRRFVRFVSHEIRTPLNTVALGLELLHSELGEFLQALQNTNTDQTTLDTSNRESVVDSSNDVVVKDTSKTLRRTATTTAPKTKKTMTLLPENSHVEAWVDLLRDVQQNTDISISILNDLLNYDKIEDGNLKLEIDVVPIWHVVKKTVMEFQIQARKREIHLESAILQWEDTTTTDALVSRSNNNKAPSLDLECPDHIFQTKVIGDETRLCQVLRNLISNSLKFTPAGGQIQVKALYKPDGLPQAVTPKLPKRFVTNKDDSQSNKDDSQSSLCSDDDPLGQQKQHQTTRTTTPPRAGSIRISVKDSGTGMTKEQLSQLFSEGVQFDANKLQAGGGSGLGLYITKGLVEQHGGFIAVASEGKGFGSEFTVELPLFQFQESSLSLTTFDIVESEIANHDDDHHDMATTHQSIEDSNNCTPIVELVTQQQRILVVDDALTNRKMLSRLLERDGHECLQAKDGKEAVDLYLNEIEQMKTTKHDDNNSNVDKYQPFSTILLDYEMPIMNGPECCQILRAQHGCQALIFGVTGNLLGEDVKFFEEMGADCVLPKPVSIKQLEKAWAHYGKCHPRIHKDDTE